jgi:hypothetical protein
LPFFFSGEGVFCDAEWNDAVAGDGIFTLVETVPSLTAIVAVMGGTEGGNGRGRGRGAVVGTIAVF